MIFIRLCQSRVISVLNARIHVTQLTVAQLTVAQLTVAHFEKSLID